MATAPTINTPRFRGSYVFVINPKDQKKDDGTIVKEYSLMALFPKGADLSAMKAAASQVLVEKLGTDQAKWPKNIRSPFRDQNELEKEGKQPEGTEAGAIFVNFKNTQRPGVVDANVQDILEERQVYSGAYFIANVRPFYYGDKPQHKGNKGVSFTLLNLQKVGDGDPLGGRVRPTDAFKPVETAAAEGGASSVFD